MISNLVLPLGSTEIVVPREFIQLFFAAIIGLGIGTERAFRGKVASLRTFAMISTGSCLFTMLSMTADGSGSEHDITRIAAQVVSGVGFIGGGVIFKQIDRIEGVTSAAMIWLTAALGMACGFNQLTVTVYGLIVVLFINFASIALHRTIARIRLARRKASHTEGGGS